MDAFLKSLGTDVQDFIDLRRDLHQHPELSFAEHRTSDIVAKRLARMGYTVELGIGGTGVVGSSGAAMARGISAYAPTWMPCPSKKKTPIHGSASPGA